MLKAVLLDGAIIVAVTLFIEAPAQLIATPAPEVRHFLIGFLFNGVRIHASASPSSPCTRITGKE